MISEFKNQKVDRAEKYSIEDKTNFTISNSDVTVARKKFKNLINPKNNFPIRLEFVNPESTENFNEKGWDKEKQMSYYLAYFNKENKP